MPDKRSLYIRVRALAQRFDAIAIGARKRAGSVQDAPNAERDAATLHEAANRLERAQTFEPDLPEAVDTGNPELDALVSRANRVFNALSQDERNAHRKAQMESFIRGMMPTGDPAFD